MINITGDSGYSEITTPKGIVKIEYKIMNGGIVFGFDNEEIAKEAFEFEKKKGTKVKSVGKNGFIEIYRGKSKEELRQKLRDEIERGGGTWNESKN